MYRKSAKPPELPAGDLTTVRSYPDTVMAEADRAHLSSQGITGHVIEAASFNPALASAMGGVRLQVAERDLERAAEILGAIAPEESEGDDEGEGVVRCPRCELAYCAHERLHLHNAAPGLAVMALPLVMLFSGKRWRCHKCGHVWDDPKAGPAAVTRLKPGDPRPVFRLRRAHGGMGLFLGAGAGAFITLLVPGGAGTIAFLVLAALGASVGRGLRYDVCSVPECRAPLPPDAEACPKCKGGIAGVVHSAPEHYVAAADFRRELAGIRTAASAKKKRKKAARLSS